MKTRTLGTAVVLAGLLLVAGLPATPAAAAVSTYTDVHLHEGVLDLYALFDTDPSMTIDLAAACDQESELELDDGDTSWLVSFELWRETTLAGDGGAATHLADIDLAIVGSYALGGPGVPMSLTGTGLLTISFYQLDDECEPSETLDCVVLAANVAMSGILNNHGHAINALGGGHRFTGDYTMLSGANSDFEVIVTGNACGAMAAVDNGSASLGNMSWDDINP